MRPFVFGSALVTVVLFFHIFESVSLALRVIVFVAPVPVAVTATVGAFVSRENV